MIIVRIFLLPALLPMFWELSGLASLFKNSTPISTLKEKASTHMMFRIILNLHAPWVSGLRGFIITATPFLALSALSTRSCPPIQKDFFLPLQCTALLEPGHFLHTSLNPLLKFLPLFPLGLLPGPRMLFPFLMAAQIHPE